MKQYFLKKLSRTQQAGVIALGSLLVAFLVAQIDMPGHLEARLLSMSHDSSSGSYNSVYRCYQNPTTSTFAWFTEIDSPGPEWTSAQSCPMGGQACYKNTNSNHYVLDAYTLAPSWTGVDPSECSGMNTGDMKDPAGNILTWSQRNGYPVESGDGSYPNAYSGSGTPTHASNPPNSNTGYMNNPMHGVAPEAEPMPSPGTTPMDGNADQGIKDAERFLKDSWRHYKDRQRELERNFRGSAADSTSAKSLMPKWEAKLQELDQALSEKDLTRFWDTNQELSDITWEVDQAFQGVYNVQRAGNIDRQLKDRTRELSDMERQIKQQEKDSKRGGKQIDTSAAKQHVETFRSALNGIEQKYRAMSDADKQDQTKMSDLEYEFNTLGDTARDFWDSMQAVQAMNQQGDADRLVKEKQRFLKDKERAIKENERAKKNTVELNTILGNIKGVLSQMEQKVGDPNFDSQAFWDLNSEMDQLDRDFWDLNQQSGEEDRLLQEGNDMMRNVKRLEHDVSNMARECDRGRCSDKAIGLMGQMKTNYEDLRQKASGKDFEAFHEANGNLDDVQRDFWDSMREDNDFNDSRRFLKETEREIQDKTRWIEELKQESKKGFIEAKGVTELETILGQMKTKIEEARLGVEAKDYEKARDIMEFELHDLRQNFEGITGSFDEQRDIMFFQKEVKNIAGEIDQAESELKKLAVNGEMGPEDVQVCQGVIDNGRSLTKGVEAAFAAQDFDQVEKLRFEMEDLGNKADRHCSRILPNSPDYESFNETYIEKDYRDVAKDVFERINEDVASHVMDQIKNDSFIVNRILEKVGERFAGEIAKTLEATSFIPENFQQEILNRKASLLEQMKEVEDLEKQLEQQKKLLRTEISKVSQIRDRIASYNFIGDAGADIEEELERFIEDAGSETISRDEINQRIKELDDHAKQAIEEARGEKFEKGVIPFLDADDTEWFSKYASLVKQQGWVKGTGESNFKELNPGAQTNVAEAVTMLGRVLGEEAGNRNSALKDRLPDWAQAGAAALQNAGVDLRSIFGNKRGGDGITRAEVARLVQSVFDLQASNASDFADIGEASQAEQEAIGAVNRAGIMTGEGDGTRFNAAGAMNRAALVKVMTKAAEITGALSEQSSEDPGNSGE